MDFVTPADRAPIPIYHVMNSASLIEDSNREPPDVTDEQVISWYKNMMTGKIGASIEGKTLFLTDNNGSQHHG